jgi:hypothetical protein
MYDASLSGRILQDAAYYETSSWPNMCGRKRRFCGNTIEEGDGIPKQARLCDVEGKYRKASLARVMNDTPGGLNENIFLFRGGHSYLHEHMSME